jgi:hypothetical protein
MDALFSPYCQAAVTAVLSAILTIDDDCNHYRNVIEKLKKGRLKS